MKKYSRCIYVLIATIIISCAPGPEEQANEMMKYMNIEKKIGQMLMAGVPGSSISPAAIEIIRRYMPGGIILFGYNVHTTEQMSSFIDALQQESISAAGIPLFVSIDQEGGRVKRITEGITQFPGNMAMGVANDEDLTFKAARILGMELRLCGINMNLAPDMDVNNNPRNPVINTRSFGASVPHVISLGRKYIKGLQKARCMAVAKHFPGHGDTSMDSHKTLPAIHYGIDRLNRVELPPFHAAVRAGVSCIMTAHISYPGILGSDEPATLSHYFLTDVLRKTYKFKGIIISDDMEMDAISKRMRLDDAAVRSVLAGSDIILVSSNGPSIPVIINGLKKAVQDGVISEERINSSVRRILAAKYRYEIMYNNEKRTEPVLVKYKESHIKLIKQADKVNAALSRKAICYSGQNVLPTSDIWGNYASVVFVSENRQFLGLVRSFFGDRVKSCSTGYIQKGLSEGKKTLLYYHIDKADGGTPASLSRVIGQKDTELVIVSTGNPYPLLLMEKHPPVLFSFSNTEESMRQIFTCIMGEFLPEKRFADTLGMQ